MDIQQIITQSIQTGFINQMIQSDKSYRPELLTNDHKQGKKVLSTILRELETCEEFWFSVAFVTTSGIATLMNTLIELEKKNIKGKILASQYLNFTQPEALKRLKQFKNIELRIATEGAFHSKGYLFKNKGVYDLIIGSSNLTQTALCSNKEWNLKISATEESELIDQVEKEFHKEFEAAQIVTDKYLLEYGILWKEKMQFERTIKQKRKAIDKVVITPNLMQREALENINHLRAEGKGKALLVSATGTGKTFLSAFDVQQFKPKKFLFIVHRRTIAEEAMKTFQGLLSDDIKMGIYSGAQRELNADYIFCTVQTISKQEHLDKFKRNHFDYIVILQPTSPLRDVLHINAAIKLYFEKYKGENDTLASVYKVDKKNAWLMQFDNNDEYINFCLKVDLSNPQRQKLMPLYLPNGSIFIIKGECIDSGIYHQNTIPFLMDEADSEDVDTIEDFRRAENALIKKVKGKAK